MAGETHRCDAAGARDFPSFKTNTAITISIDIPILKFTPQSPALVVFEDILKYRCGMVWALVDEHSDVDCRDTSGSTVDTSEKVIRCISC